MTDASEITLPPPPKADGRSKEARRRRLEEQAASAAAGSLKAEMAASEPTPNEIRTRPTRAEGVRRERRRREGVDKSSNLKLGFRFKRDPNYEYRWINHGVDGQRIHDLTVEDDWTMVSAEGEEVNGVGSGMRRAVGKDASGPLYSYLCRKPKDLYEEDHKKLQRKNDERMQHIRKGIPPTDIARKLKTTDNVYGAEDIRVEEAGASGS